MMDKLKVIKEMLLYYFSKKINYPLSAPRNVTLTLNYICNQDCIMCNIKHLAFDKTKEITFFEIKKIIDEMCMLNIPELVLTGGEPFLYKDIFKVIDYAHEKKLRVIMITNGYYDDQVVSQIIRSPVDHLQISLDGSTAEIYELIRRRKGSFAVVVANIKKLVASGKSVAVTATINRYNYKDLMSIANLARQLGCRRLALRPAHVSNADPLNNDFSVIPFWISSQEQESFRQVCEKLKRFNDETGFLDFCPGVELLPQYFSNGYIPSRGSCFIGFTRLIISYNDRGSYGVWMCKDMIGDIRKDSLKDIWYGASAKQMRKRLKKCKNACLFPEIHEPEIAHMRSLLVKIKDIIVDKNS